ncbi:MAG: flavodoxin-dependent (E)-4-hydroxy-3-methylbut-2-enyl-diphosphate synthase [Candidatus Eiseniibacteriota bacterium]|jgi:(E)-4-hydroxy-3-methylbut-2-enyl-diphosphate synthase
MSEPVRERPEPRRIAIRPQVGPERVARRPGATGSGPAARGPHALEPGGHRDTTRPLRIGPVQIGGGAPVSVQTMTKTDTSDVGATTEQIRSIAAAGGEIVRLAVPDNAAAAALARIRAASPLPLIADIHFNYLLALRALEAGVDGLRLNPGNIGGRDRVQEVAQEAKARGVPIRIGVNAGSLERDLLEAHGGPTPEAMVESAERHLRMLEEADFHDVKVSLKASNVPMTVAAYRCMAERHPVPLHLGITEAGTARSGSIKSAVGLGILLAEGIGDTIRVSLAADPVEEVLVGIQILRALGLRPPGVNVIACPSCGRTEIDVERVADAVERRIGTLPYAVDVAVMGCAVNGPGEAAEAQLGFAAGGRGGLLYRDGKVVGRVQASEDEIADVLAAEVERWAHDQRADGAETAPGDRDDR